MDTGTQLVRTQEISKKVALLLQKRVSLAQQHYKERVQKIAFIRGEAPVEFATVARVVDVMRQLDLSVGLLTPKLEQSR